MKISLVALSLLLVLSTGTFAEPPTQNTQPKHESAVAKLFSKKIDPPKIVLAPIKVVTVDASVEATSLKKKSIARNPIIHKLIIHKPTEYEPVSVKQKQIITIPLEEKTNVQRLLELVDRMSPAQAMEFQTKLTSKILSPVPESFMNGLNVNVGGALRMASLSAINNMYSTTFGNMGVLIESDVEGTWPLIDDLRVGLKYATGQSSISKKTAATVYEDLNIRYSSLGGFLQWDFYREPSFMLTSELGLGYVVGEYSYSKVDETNAASDLQTLRQGGVVAVSLGLSSRWTINPVWRWGLGVSYELENIKDLRRSNASDPSAPVLDLSGINVELSTSFLF